MKTDRGPWCQTYTGKMFHPLNPSPEEVDIFDIAHALGNLCRYNGHCRHFYSVAEHSVLLADNVPPSLARWALMHDAAEAYMGDVIRPIKHAIPELLGMERRILAAICEAFDLRPNDGSIPLEVRKADLAMLAAEQRPMMGDMALPWELGVMPLEGVTFRFWNPSEASRAFLGRFYELWPDRHPAARAA